MSPSEFEEETGEAVPISGTALSVLNRSEIEQQIAAAEKRPRSIDKFRMELEKYSTLTPEVALTMFYSLKRADKPIVGPSVRFAEVMAICWRNLRAGSRPLGADSTTVSAQGLYYDCETNVGFTVEAQRSIMGNRGRFSNDMITVTGNAAASIAYRNAIFKGVPRGLWLDIYEKTKACAVGKVESFAATTMSAMEYFAKSGATELMVLNTLGVKSVRDITADHILVMRVWAHELKEGEKSIEDIFGSQADAEIEDIMDELDWSGAQKTMARNNHKGRRDELLEFLRTKKKEADAATGKTPAAAKTTAKPKESVAPDPTPTPATAEQSTTSAPETKTQESAPAASGKAQTTTAAASTSQASKPAASKEEW
jgi:hypothetical protein